MAYLDLSTLPAGDMAVATAQPMIPRETLGARGRLDEGTLSSLEWNVVSLARRDRLSSLNPPPGKWTRRILGLFALPHDPRLADPRLEALRRISVLSWHRGYGVPPSEVRAFLSAGYSPAHYDLIAGHAIMTQAEERRGPRR